MAHRMAHRTARCVSQQYKVTFRMWLSAAPISAQIALIERRIMPELRIVLGALLAIYPEAEWKPPAITPRMSLAPRRSEFTIEVKVDTKRTIYMCKESLSEAAHEALLRLKLVTQAVFAPASDVLTLDITHCPPAPTAPTPLTSPPADVTPSPVFVPASAATSARFARWRLRRRAATWYNCEGVRAPQGRRARHTRQRH